MVERSALWWTLNRLWKDWVGLVDVWTVFNLLSVTMFDEDLMLYC